MASSNFTTGKVFSFDLISELTAFMPNVACSLVSSIWASFALPLHGEIKSPLGEAALESCNLSHILFGVGAFSSREPIIVRFSTVEEEAPVKIFMNLRFLLDVFKLSQGLLIVRSLLANVTFFGWHLGFYDSIVCSI